MVDARFEPRTSVPEVWATTSTTSDVVIKIVVISYVLSVSVNLQGCKYGTVENIQALLVYNFKFFNCKDAIYVICFSRVKMPLLT